MNEQDFDRFRANVEHEDDLINHRTSWMLISQSFLLGACIAASRYPSVVRCLGTVVTACSMISVLAAINAIADVQKKCAAGFTGNVPPLVSSRWGHRLGLFATIGLHLAFLAVWWLL